MTANYAVVKGYSEELVKVASYPPFLTLTVKMKSRLAIYADRHVSVVVLLVGLVYALLALRGAFEDTSVPRTLGLMVFSLVHGGAFSISVPAGPSLLEIGGSFWLRLPPTAIALLPFIALLVLGRFVA